MGNRPRTLTFVRWLSAGLRSESQFFNLCVSLQQAASRLTGSNFGFLPRKDHGLIKGRLVEQPTLTIAVPCSQLLSSEFPI